MSKPAFDITRLSQDERLRLIEELWESLSQEERDAIPLTESQQRELDRRLDRVEDEGTLGLSAEDVRTRIKRSTS